MNKGDIFMEKRNIVLLPKTIEILSQMGEQIKMARLRRKLSAELVAERAGVSRTTLWSVEKGSPSVAIGAYAAILHALDAVFAADEDLHVIGIGTALQEGYQHILFLQCLEQGLGFLDIRKLRKSQNVFGAAHVNLYLFRRTHGTFDRR